MDRIMILGTGNAQYDAIQFLKEQGMKVYCCSNVAHEPAKELCDVFKLINIVDRDAVLDYAKTSGVHYVYSVGSDIAMPSAMYVSEKLGLPHFVPERTATICNCKNLLRTFLGTDFSGNVPFYVLSQGDAIPEDIIYPMIVKPADSQGQRGVASVYNEEELKRAISEGLRYSRAGKVIVEKLIDGREVSVNAFVVNGEVIFSRISDRESFKEFPGGIIKEHHLPSTWADMEAQNKIDDLVKRTVDRLKIENGPVYFQLMIDRENDVYLIEVTPRLDGCHMWHAILFYDGVNLLQATFDLLRGKEVRLHRKTSETSVHLKFMSQRTGTTFNPDHHPLPEHLLFSREYMARGETVRKLTGYMEKCGYYIYKGEK